MLLDNSGSMIDDSGGRRWLDERAIAAQLLLSLPESTAMAVWSFGVEVEPLSQFGQPHDVSIQQIRSMKRPFGRTGLWDAIAKAAEAFGEPTGHDVIVVVSDGGDNRSHLHNSRVPPMLGAKGIRLFAAAIAYRYGRAPTPEEAGGPGDLASVARDTGGLAVTFAPPLTRKEFDLGTTALVVALANSYELEFNDGAPQPKKIKLKVGDSRGKPYPHLVVTEPEKIACPAPSARH